MKQFFKRFSLLVFLTLQCQCFTLFGQGGSLFGVIQDKKTGEELIGATIILTGTNLGATSDYNGNYSLTGLKAGEQTFEISYLGYATKTEIITILLDQSVTRNIEMEYEVIEGVEVTITAQADAQNAAINRQLSARSIVNVVSAKKIQELPDANAAETVGRLPGVSILRSGGEGNKVVIRGLSPKYNKIMVEGISMSGGEGDRSADISMISPYSLDGIEVYKAVTADQDADFIGGSVNFKLRSAAKGLKSNIVAQGGYNGLRNTLSDYLVVASISNRYLNDKLGIYLQGTTESRNRSSNEMSAGYFVENNAEIGIINPVIIGLLNLNNIDRTRKRNGATAVLDYKLSNGSIKLMNLYNSGTTDVSRNGESYRVNSRTHEYRTTDDRVINKINNTILSLEKRIGKLNITGKASYSTTVNERPQSLEFFFRQNGAIKSEALNNQSVGPTALQDFTTINDSTTFFDGFSQSQFMTEEKQSSISLNLEYDIKISSNISGKLKVGGKYRHKNRFHDREVFGSDLVIGSGQSGNDALINHFPSIADKVTLGNRIPYYLFRDNTHLSDEFLQGDYKLGTIGDINMLKEAFEVLSTSDKVFMDGYFKFDRSSKTFDYSGTEDLMAGYIMADIDLGTKIKIIPGMRYEQNSTEYTGTRGEAGFASIERLYASFDTTTTRENSFLLPMIHLKISPTKWFNIRGAYTQTLSRPSYNQIMPRQDILTLAEIVSYNNRNLKPEFSTNYDLYLSFHNNKLGLLTLGGFSKRIENQILNLGRRVLLDPSEAELEDRYRLHDIYTTKNNDQDALVRGIEAEWQTNFWYLPGLLQGLVLNLNYTHIFSEAKYPFTEVINIAEGPFSPPELVNIDSFYVSRLIDQPSDIVNLQLGYDIKGFSGRISMLYQSNTFKNANFWPELSPSIGKYVRWDFSAKQKLPFYNAQLFMNINNITSAFDRELVRQGTYDSSIQDYGTTVDLGISFKL